VGLNPIYTVKRPNRTAENIRQTAKAAARARDAGETFSLASGTVDGRTVLKNVDNTESIRSSLTNSKELDGIREVPMTGPTGESFGTGRHYSVEGNKRITELTRQIKASGEISPLIVVMDKNGPYILEGSTRIEALHRLGAKSFPAKVVVDLD